MRYDTYRRVLRDRERTSDDFTRRMLAAVAIELRTEMTAAPRQARHLRAAVQWGVLAFLALVALAAAAAGAASALGLIELRGGAERYVWGVLALLLASGRAVVRLATRPRVRRPSAPARLTPGTRP